MRFPIVVFFVLLTGTALAQTFTPDNRRPSMPTSLHPVSPESAKAPRLAGKTARKYRTHSLKHDGSHIETYEEYVARMKRTVKMIRRNEKLIKRPQYSNPMYFGHKRPPKKHKPSKMRFCSECGIRH